MVMQNHSLELLPQSLAVAQTSVLGRRKVSDKLKAKLSHSLIKGVQGVIDGGHFWLWS